ncbi:hypothetical protein BGAL_0251g00060 [Botrytis galanthina]|uniref:Uncharacterized protein n=1 Tax=Botrytis galanthina TaxID=278940 RepID=A0A4S8QWN1_9HELO|nr:hypothetical protein BGAL_0251g00060 [Botrytis galanthina]
MYMELENHKLCRRRKWRFLVQLSHWPNRVGAVEHSRRLLRIEGTRLRIQKIPWAHSEVLLK